VCYTSSRPYPFMSQLKVIFELDNPGSAHQFEVVTGASGKDYLFVKKETGGMKHEFTGTQNEYDFVVRDILTPRRVTPIFVFPVVEEAPKPVKNAPKSSKG
jgi:hypothetical protein